MKQVIELIPNGVNSLLMIWLDHVHMGMHFSLALVIQMNVMSISSEGNNKAEGLEKIAKLPE